ncbi:PorT family protein [Myroides sp. M-43]|uniref:outer membrane beta-barrel protein n=1 Tax=Myroides oncorhynchi TaxID=2893756 RepID=UPI001E414DD2|nr:outer membrane beta-barrel protein [Myroides oncorhynchi]MCC9042461.1 PorT family protein [Myroides oncorhynchi]
MRIFLCFLVFCICSLSFSQNKFDVGYYIDNNGNKVGGLIRDMDWKNNPVRFAFKNSEEGEVRDVVLADAKEFYISGKAKYLRGKVKVDMSSEYLQNMSTDSLPEYKEETVFLKVLVEGKATLFRYSSAIGHRFFYLKDNSIEPLVFKKYMKTNTKRGKNDGNTAKNEMYKRQIWTEFNCDIQSRNKIKSLEYNEKDLVKYFKNYNECEGETTVEVYSKGSYKSVALALKGQLSSANFKFDNSEISNANYDLGSAVGYGLGLEIEYTFPFNNKKWGMFIEPTYKHYSFSKSQTVVNETLVQELKYNMLELPIGARYYMFISDKSKLFINVGVQFSFDMSSTLKLSQTKELDVKSGNNAFFGVGYKYNRFSFEYRINTKRSLTKNYSYWDSSFNSMSFTIGYSFAKF